jgi:membrane-bound metal-dependent hydrolase YbcI (DUF457 family)
VDLFTHVLFAYLLSFVIWGPGAPQYIAAGALAGGLPDSDIVLFPLARRFPALHHRGIVHSVLGVTLIALAGAALLPLVPPFLGASFLPFFVAMEIGGLSHLVLDGFTNYAVTPLAPFSTRYLRLDADVAVNFSMLALTGVSLIVLGFERGAVPFGLWVDTTWALVAVYGGYLVLRSWARTHAGRIAHHEGFDEVRPTTSPWSWMLLHEEDPPDHYTIRFRNMMFGEQHPGVERSLTVAKVPPRLGPVGSPQEAMERTYLPAMGRSWWLSFRPHFAEVVEDSGTYIVTWFAVEARMLGRRVGVRATIHRVSGEIELRSGLLGRPRAE